MRLDIDTLYNHVPPAIRHTQLAKGSRFFLIYSTLPLMVAAVAAAIFLAAPVMPTVIKLSLKVSCAFVVISAASLIFAFSHHCIKSGYQRIVVIFSQTFPEGETRAP